MTLVPDALRSALADRYRIERELGAGGMATVYLAEDLRHRRQVAIKVLRPELAVTLGPDRFATEIEVAARLQHPHILPLHDSGEAGGFLYYVMPYVEGVSLRERLQQQGELPIVDTVRILTEITEALAYAHAQGVVHRDLKPDNIMLSGRHPMVMDFGIAKAVTAASGPRGPTSAGVALGTPAYMAPEQAVADPLLDHRVDLYAIGVIGYELLTGQPPFAGMPAHQVLAAHVSQAPVTISARRASVPAALEAILMRCLEKRPADRPQKAEDVLHALEALSTQSGGLSPAWALPLATGAGSAQRRGRFALVAATVVLAVAIAAVMLVWRTEPSVGVVEETQLTSSGAVLRIALSPDGTMIAYTTRTEGRVGQLILQEVASGATRVMSEDLLDPIPDVLQWTGDGRSVLYVGMGADSQRVALSFPVLGGAPRRLPLANDERLRISPDLSTHAYWRDEPGSPLRIVDAVTGNSRELLLPDSLDYTGNVDWSPDGSRLALSKYSRKHTRYEIHSVDARTGEWSLLHSDTASLRLIRWIGNSIYSNRAAGEVVRIELSRRGSRAGRVTVVSSGMSMMGDDISSDGQRMVRIRSVAYQELWVREGAAGQPAFASRRLFQEAIRPDPDGMFIVFPITDPVLSPDGRQVAFVRRPPRRRTISSFGGGDLFVASVGGGGVRQLTTDGTILRGLAWSPNGDRIVITEEIAGDSSRALRTVAVREGFGSDRRYAVGMNRPFAVAWTPGKGILYGTRRPRALRWLDPASGIEEALPWADSADFDEASLSPDGRWVWLGDRPNVLAELSGSRLVPVDSSAVFVGWSDDSQSVYYWTARGDRHCSSVNGGRCVVGVFRVSLGTSVEVALPFNPSGCRASGSLKGLRFICMEISSVSDVWLHEGFDPDVPRAKRD